MKFNELQKNISYQFNDLKLLEEALTHPSFTKKNDAANYQRLEFLGDTILSMIIAELLIKKYPWENEGQLSKRQAYLISGEVIAEVAQKINLGKFIKLSVGEEAIGGRMNKRNLENSLEALIGAIYLDSDLHICQKFVINNWHEIIDKDMIPPQDPVSYLQEIVQCRTKKLPKYLTNRTGGDEHKPIFTSIVEVDGVKYAANGLSKKEAQKKAAICALEKIAKD
jgi:ribonuclease-3